MKNSLCENKSRSKKRKIRRNPAQQKNEIRNCGGEYNLSFNEKLIINSPNYPSEYQKNMRCNYFLKSPPNTLITTKFIDIDLEESSKDICVDGVEFRYYSLGQSGPV